MALDEIHRLLRPAEVLKIAADYFPDVRVIATGSSTLAAKAKFSDTLTGRRFSLWLTPMMSRDLEDFGAPSLGKRLWYGGLPPYFLAAESVLAEDSPCCPAVLDPAGDGNRQRTQGVRL